MAAFFIDRPVFAWILALAVIIAGALALTQLPVAQYPRLAPPRIVIDAVYPGASTEAVDANVGSIIEESLDGADGMLYYETASDGLGNLEIAATFAPGTNPDIAMMDVQNRLKQVEPRLPQQVVQQGISVFKAANTFLILVALTSTDGTRDSAQLSDILSRDIMRELKRAPGVGSAQLWDADEAWRVWLDPMKLREFGLAGSDVNAAIAAQNASVAAGTLGDAPLMDGQQLSASVSVKGQLLSPEEFGQIVLKAHPDGSAVRLADVARVEIGRDNYTFWSRLNGKPSATVGIQLGPRGNALETSDAIRARLAELASRLPPGVAVQVPFDSARFVNVAIREVLITLAEAILLVFLVMWLFLRDLRYALVPTVVIPVTLMGAFVTMYAFGLSINVFTMFGLVLAIGVLVDDAIVVVESVHRVMDEEGMAPRDATLKAMKQIGGAIVGVTAVLTAVFVPMVFFPGGVGGICRQFAVAMIASMLVSSFMALSLTPALCANLLSAPAQSVRQRDARRGLRGVAARLSTRFEQGFDRASRGYRAMTAAAMRRVGPLLAVYAVLLLLCGALYWRMPGGFLPVEDQGQLQVMIQLPAGATQARTLAVVEKTEPILRMQTAVANVTSVIGWSFEGSGQNVAMSFVTLKDWGRRGVDAMTLRDTLNRSFSRILDGNVQAQLPPSVPGVGHSDGFTFRLEDRGGLGRDALKAARDQLAERAKADPSLASIHFEDLPDAPRIELDVDRAKAYALGLSFDRIADVVGSTFWLALRRRFSGGWPDAPRPGGGRCVDADDGNRSAGVVGAEPVGRDGAAVVGCDAPLDHRASRIDALQRLSVARSERPCGERCQFGGGDGGDGAARGELACRHRVRLGRCGARRTRDGAADAVAARTVAAGGVHGAGRAIRKLDDSARGVDGRTAWRSRRHCGDADARHAERRLLQGWDDHSDRLVREKRDPDRAIRARPEPTRRAADARGDTRGGRAISSDRDDVVGVPAGRRAAVAGERRRCGKPPVDRYGRVRRRRDGDLARAGVCAGRVSGGGGGRAARGARRAAALAWLSASVARVDSRCQHMIGSRAVDLQIRTREAFVFKAEPLEESRAAQIVGPVIRHYAMQLLRAKDVVDCVAQPFAREARDLRCAAIPGT
ncbi:hydrophobe/amphiphile efflux-1 (HAE1) family protein [Paraburkholderia sp. MM5384-R2]|nr:hydrophobe/amphiphile efflux-1 (HAE1) family protein [Paraburkholderia sp. MM5384-R2]